MHPEKIGPYRIDRKIGAGGMGNVYHGIHEKTGQVAAIKVLPAAMAREDGFVQRFNREIEALRKLKNRNIVELFGDGESDDTYYYAMEFVDGITLTAEITDHKRLPWPDVIDLSLQIAGALKAAHDAGIVHRDLKPSNLMLTKERVVKLTDFGVAAVFATTRLTRTGGVVGTAEYMSPEQAQGKRATKRSDLYSLGSVMYAMLTGRPPFTGPTANDILQKHQFGTFDKPSRYAPDIPRPLEDLVCLLMEKDPFKRPADAIVLMKRLEQIRTRIAQVHEADEPVTMERPSPGETIRGPNAAEYSEHHPGPATLVRDLLREEAADAMRKSPVARFFDNTLVLLVLLALIIAGGFWFRNNNRVDPQDQLDRARAILKGSAGPAWLRARDDMLQPLLTNDSMTRQRPIIRGLISQVDQYEFSRSLRTSNSSDGSAQSELQRLIRRAFETYSSGDPVRAAVEIEAIASMIQGDPRYTYLHRFLTESARQWKTDQEIQSRRHVLQHVLETAQAAVHNDQIATARAKLQAALSIYESDDSVAEELAQCRQLLQTLPADDTAPEESTLPPKSLPPESPTPEPDSPESSPPETSASEPGSAVPSGIDANEPDL